MRALLLIALLSPLGAHAALKENPRGGEPDLGRCYANGAVFFHHIVAKLGAGRYEMVSEVGVLGRGVLKTKRTLQPGVAALPMRYTGTKSMELTSGFTAEVRQWEECR